MNDSRVNFEEKELSYLRKKCQIRRKRLRKIGEKDDIFKGISDKEAFIVRSVKRFIIDHDLYLFTSLMESVNLTYKMSWYKNV